MALREVVDHPKFARLKMALRVGKFQALGALECMWHFTARFTPQGNIGKYSAEYIEAWLEWDGEEGALIAAFIRAGWIDLDDEHGMVVHDWYDHADSKTHADMAKKTLLFVGGQRPRIDHESYSGQTRNRLRAEFDAKYGTESRQCPDKVPTVSQALEPEPSDKCRDTIPPNPENSGHLSTPLGSEVVTIPEEKESKRYSQEVVNTQQVVMHPEGARAFTEFGYAVRAAASELPKFRWQPPPEPPDLEAAESQFVGRFGSGWKPDLDTFCAFYRDKPASHSDPPICVALMRWAKSAKAPSNGQHESVAQKAARITAELRGTA